MEYQCEVLTFNDLPGDIKLEVFKHVADVNTYALLATVCSEWYQLVLEESIWRPLFQRDFGAWIWTERNSETEGERSTKHRKKTINWRQQYQTYYLRGWQFDMNNKHANIDLSNDDFTISLASGDGYNGVRTTRGVSSGSHYFEILVEIPSDPAEEERFDRGTEISLSLGVADQHFNVHDCGSGWSTHNRGIGYYNDGSVYVVGEQHTLSRKIKVRSGDRLGTLIDMDQDIVPTVTFYINGDKMTDKLTGFPKGHLVFPHVILASSTKIKVSIFSRFLNYPKVELTAKQIAYKQFAVGKDHYDNGHFKESIPYFSLALNWNENWKTCLKWRAKAYHKIESWSEAINDFTKLLELDSSSANSWIARGVVYEALAKTDPYYNDKAFYDYTKAIELDERNSTAYNNRAIIRENMRQHKEALGDYSKAIEYKPSCPIAYKNRADLYETMNEYELALQDYCVALQHDPEYTPAYNDRGCLYKKMGKFKLALEDYSKACELTGKYYHYSNRAHVKEMLGLYDSALEDYSKAIELESNNRLAYNNRSSLWNLFKEYEKAIEDSNKTIILAPTQANPYSHRAFALCEQGKLQEALENVEKSIHLNPMYPRSYCYKAYILYKKKELEEALLNCEKCIQLHSEEIPDVYYVRALISLEKGEKKKAKEDLEKCIDIKFKVRVFNQSLASSLLEQLNV